MSFRWCWLVPLSVFDSTAKKEAQTPGCSKNRQKHRHPGLRSKRFGGIDGGLPGKLAHALGAMHLASTSSSRLDRGKDWLSRLDGTLLDDLVQPFNTSSVVFEGILEGNAEGWTLGFAIWSPDTRETTKYDDTRLMYLVNSQRSNNQLKFLI